MNILISSISSTLSRCDATLVRRPCRITITTRRRGKRPTTTNGNHTYTFHNGSSGGLLAQKISGLLNRKLLLFHAVLEHEFVVVTVGPAVPLLVCQTCHSIQQHVQYDREHLQEHPTCHCYRIDSIIVLRYSLSPPIFFTVSFHPPNADRFLLVNHLLYRNSWLYL